MQDDDRLKALFAAQDPPARDAAFSSAVMARVMQRRFVTDLAALSGVSGLGGAMLWAVWPSLQPALVSLSQGLAPTLVAIAVAVGASVILTGRRASALLGLEI